MTLATCIENIPYCCSLFYALDAERGHFYFMSSTDTKHIQQALQHSSVAGTIVSSDVSIARLQGIQFTGKFFKPDGDLIQESKKIYLRIIPAAAFSASSLWAIEIQSIKMTDNTLGFGKKITWLRENQKEFI